MNYAVQPGKVSKPTVTVSGDSGGDIDITAVTAVLEVGKIPVATIAAPPEYSEGLLGHQTNQRFRISVAGKPVFTGYISGPSGRCTGESINYSNGLVHLSRDLDQSRMWCPGIHPMSMDDWQCYFVPGFSNDVAILDVIGRDFDCKKELMGEVIRVVKAMLETTLVVKQASLYGDLTGIQADAATVIPLLSRFYAPQRNLMHSSISSNVAIDLSIGQFMAAQMTQSRNSNRSVWDTMQLMFSHLGMTTVCDASGNVMVVPIYTGCAPPSGNFIDDDWILGYDYNSVYHRNVGNVLLLSHASQDFGGGLPGSVDGPVKSLISRSAMYPPKKDTKSPGSGTLVLPVPRWLTPQLGGQEAVDVGVPQGLLDLYAKSIFFEYRNSGRAVKLITPFCPGATPGTCISFQPSTKMKPFSGKKTDQGPKSGYLWKVIHVADVESKTFQTEWYIESIYLQSEFGSLLSSPPSFDKSCTPFALQ